MLDFSLELIIQEYFKEGKNKMITKDYIYIRD